MTPSSRLARRQPGRQGSRRAFERAFAEAGCPNVVFHDLRRTAARKLVRAGVGEKAAMKLMGHLTRSIFDRYTIVDEAMLSEEGEKLAAHHAGQAAERKVVDIREAKA